MALSRSQQMSRIRGRHTKPEESLRHMLVAAGLRCRRYKLTPAGRPDFVFSAAQVALYLDGCQWHGCPVHYVPPRSNVAFWSAKLAMNSARDRRQTLLLESLGWQVVRVWEHEVIEAPDQVIGRIRRVLSAVRARQAEP